MGEEELLKAFQAMFKACDLRAIVEAAARAGVPVDAKQFVSSLACGCVEVVRSNVKTKLEEEK